MRWIGALLLVAAVGIARAEDEKLAWREDLAAARREATRAGKPLLVMFRCVP